MVGLPTGRTCAPQEGNLDHFLLAFHEVLMKVASRDRSRLSAAVPSSTQESWVRPRLSTNVPWRSCSRLRSASVFPPEDQDQFYLVLVKQAFRTT